MIKSGITMMRRTFGFAVFFFALALSAQEPITFCSYNVRNWLLMDSFPGSKEQPRAKPEEEKTKVIESLSEIAPDVLGLCEIGVRADLEEIQARLKSLGIDLPHSEFTQGGDTTRSLGLLSRFPIKARNSQSDLSYLIGDTRFPFQRGILDVTVDVAPEFEVRFMGVHLKSKRVITEADEALMRRNEAHLLRLHLDSILSKYPQTKIVCYGDFNEHRHEPAISEIIGSRTSDGYMTDLYLKDSNGLVWTHFWDIADVYARLDYFFVSRGMRPHVDPKHTYIYARPDFDKGSDHRPIVLTLNPYLAKRIPISGE